MRSPPSQTPGVLAVLEAEQSPIATLMHAGVIQNIAGTVHELWDAATRLKKTQALMSKGESVKLLEKSAIKIRDAISLLSSGLEQSGQTA